MDYEEGYAAKEAPPEESPTSEAEQTLSMTDTLHKQIDELEGRLFGYSPKAVAQGRSEDSNAVRPRPPLINSLKYARQQLDTATNRLGNLLQRV